MKDFQETIMKVIEVDDSLVSAKFLSELRRIAQPSWKDTVSKEHIFSYSDIDEIATNYDDVGVDEEVQKEAIELLHLFDKHGAGYINFLEHTPVRWVVSNDSQPTYFN